MGTKISDNKMLEILSRIDACIIGKWVDTSDGRKKNEYRKLHLIVSDAVTKLMDFIMSDMEVEIEQTKYKCPKCFEFSVYPEPSSHERCSKCGTKNNIMTCGVCGDAFCSDCVFPVCYTCGGDCDVSAICRCAECNVAFCSEKCRDIHDETDEQHERNMWDYE